MNQINQHKAALTVAWFLGSFSFLWSLLVLVGFGQPIIDFLAQIQMVSVGHVVEPFSFISAIGLIVTMSLLGYIFSYLLASFWNAMHQEKAYKEKLTRMTGDTL